MRGLLGHAVELSDILTYGCPSTIVPSTHPRCIGAAGKVITKTPICSYGSNTLLRVPLVPCVGPASSTAPMAVTRTVLTIPGPYTHRRWSEVSFTRSQGPHDPESTMIRQRSGVDIVGDWSVWIKRGNVNLGLPIRVIILKVSSGRRRVGASKARGEKECGTS